MNGGPCRDGAISKIVTQQKVKQLHMGWQGSRKRCEQWLETCELEQKRMSIEQYKLI